MDTLLTITFVIKSYSNSSFNILSLTMIISSCKLVLHDVNNL